MHWDSRESREKCRDIAHDNRRLYLAELRQRLDKLKDGPVEIYAACRKLEDLERAFDEARTTPELLLVVDRVLLSNMYGLGRTVEELEARSADFLARGFDGT
jgi:hypothetical protein